MGRQYTDPPVVEAICEFKLARDTHWDMTVPGLLYERIKDSFPQKEQRIVQEVELVQSPSEGLQQQIRTSERMLLFSEDKKSLVQLGPRLLVINVLKPYPSWKKFRELIETAWSSLLKVVDVRTLDRIGLRYINEIRLPKKDAGLNEYFNFYPYIGSGLPQTMDTFVVRVESPYAGGRDRSRLQLSTASDFRETKSVILDIDYFLVDQSSISPEEALGWVEEAHSHVEEIFEGCITDSLREKFGE